MICAWKELLAILPPWMRRDVDIHADSSPEELRLRLNSPPELVCSRGSVWLSKQISEEDLKFCVNTASRYSPWNADTMASGYLTAAGGHRIGICGQAVCRNGQMTGLRTLTSLCIRIARDFPGIAQKLNIGGSILILGAPGWGKTTLLRDLIRQFSDNGHQVAVVDEREELFPGNFFPAGKRTDVLSGCPKAQGIVTLLRTMGPDCIAVDEVTAQEDCNALVYAGWCGVRLIATAHAASLRDFRSRPVYRPLAESGLFETAVILRHDKSWKLERMTQ